MNTSETSARKSVADRDPQPKSRLVIKWVTMTNFKSYHGSHRIGPFHQNFSAIIGPNGSGKSNLIDSLVFVFGKRASWMRLRNLRELIHNSALHGSCTHAEVAVEFCEIEDRPNSRDFVEIPNSGFMISRTVTSGSENFYKIDGNRRPQKDITDLLRSKGIDLDYNRFIILQGEVEQISLMKPKTGNADTPGFLEYLEDIIGTSAYIQPIEELQQLVEQLESLQLEKSEKFKVLDEEMKKLGETKDQTVQYLKHEKRVYQLTNFKEQLKFKILEGIGLELAEEIKQFKKAEEKAQSEHLSQVEKQKAKIERFTRAKKEKADLDSMMEKTKQNLQAMENEYESVETEINEIKKTIERNATELRDNSRKRQKLIDDKEKTINNYPKMEESLKQLAVEKVKQQANFDKIVVKFQKEFDKNKLEINELNLQRGHVEKKKKELDLAIQGSEESLLAAKTRFTKASEEYNSIKSDKTRAAQDYDDMSRKADEIGKTLEKVAKDIQENAIICDQKKVELNKLDMRWKALNGEISSKTQNRDTFEQRNHVFQKLITAQKESKISGIRGRLGDLVIVPKDLEIAFCEAGGANWNKIVVNSFNEGKKIVEYLRTNKIGSISLITIDKIMENEHLLKEYHGYKDIWNGEAQRLMDFAKTEDETIKMAVYSVLQNTLVTDTTQQANKICFGQTVRQRVVTKGGSVYDRSGVISGGGRPRFGLVRTVGTTIFNVNNDKEELVRCEQEKKDLEKQIEEKRAILNDFQAKLSVLKSDQKKLSDEQNRKNVDMRNLQDKIENLEKILPEKEKDLTELKEKEAEMMRNEAKIGEMKKLIHRCNEEIEKILAKVEVLDENQNKLGGKELKDAKTKLEEIVNEIREKEEKLNQREAEIADFEYRINKLKDSTVHLKMLEETSKNTLAGKLAQQDDIFKKTNDIVTRLDEGKKKMEEKEKQIAEAKAELQELDKLVVELKELRAKNRQKSEEVSTKIRKNDLDKNEVEEALKHCREQYQKILADYNFLNEVDFLCGKKSTAEVYRTVAKNDKQIIEINSNSGSKSASKSISKGTVEGRAVSKRKQIVPENGIQAIWDKVFEVEVFDPYDIEVMEELQNYTREIEQRIVYEREQKERTIPNLNSIIEYKNKSQEHHERKVALEDVHKQLESTKNDLDNKRIERKTRFMEAFLQISMRLKETYQILTNGGDAELEMVNCFDPFVEGISYSVRPPQKSWKQMSKLSGGEKTLSSLAFIFALHYYKPNPVYLMDEIDAALDYKNVGIVAKFVKERTKNAQFIVISLRSNMFDAANILFGVFKLDDVTNTIRFEVEEAEQIARGILDKPEGQADAPKIIA